MAKTTTTTEKSKATALVVRLYEASCDIKFPTDEDRKFRQSLQWAWQDAGKFPGTEPTKEQLIERAQVVRLYEASAKITNPTDDEATFRHGLHVDIGRALGLGAIRARHEATKATAPKK